MPLPQGTCRFVQKNPKEREAAQQLAWTVDSVKGRLERGRKLLHARLTRRGLTLSAGMLIVEGTCNLSSAAVPFRERQGEREETFALVDSSANRLLVNNLARCCFLERAWQLK